LFLGENNLSGEFPHAILNLSGSLQFLGLEMNMLGKTLPLNIGDLLPSLTNISLYSNSFKGAIPASLGNALGLQSIDLSSNFLNGKIPTSLGKLSNLTALNLELNYLEARNNGDWGFLDALGNCRSLNSLALSFNYLQGSIPQSIGNLSPSLQYLGLSGNLLSGQVPQSIGKLSALTGLALSQNYLTGTIDGWIGNLKRLQLLNIYTNGFTGPIPDSIGNLTSLTFLYISENKFEGIVPTSLGNLPLLRLDLSSNNLQGYIPPNFGNLRGLIFLNLSHNNLQGDILQIGNLENLATLDLSSNKLTGQIPDSLGRCYNLANMQMDKNFLTGNIPVTFGNLSLLSMLNLSHNNLSGTIPSTLNKLQSLENLDLSYNDLHGPIPRNGVFENATAVTLAGNPGLCGGAMDLQMASCPTVSKNTEKRYRLIEVLIPIFGFMSLVLLVYFVLLEKKMRMKRDDISPSLGEDFLKVSYADLAQATANFSESNLVGRGGYGSVYRGKLKESKVEVAVKVFDLEMHGAEKSFLKECEALRSIQHRNLLPIITACSTVDNIGNVFKALVYEFMPNGNLDTWLHQGEDGKARKQLSFAQILNISVNMADALDYLHFDCGRPTIHCDLKPSNILLDDDMNALLADFGIASLYHDSWSKSTGSVCSSSVGVKGTIGYIAPGMFNVYIWSHENLQFILPYITLSFTCISL
jgi:Leucine-rich repeat (LRR) protein